MTDALHKLLAPQRLTEVVDVGANPIDGEPPYAAMLAAGLCRITGFEPQPRALAALQASQGADERYLPYVVGDGNTHTLKICRASGMTSLFEPDPDTIGLFVGLPPHGEVTERLDVQTRRLDDIAEIRHLDFLKIDIQGGELAVFQGGRTKLAQAVAIQTEVSFVTLYQGQPPLSEIDVELRNQGFIPHCFAAIKPWPLTGYGADNPPPQTQLLEADLVYIRDIAHPDRLSDEQLKHLALIAHHCYQSYDLAMHCVALLERRQALAEGSRAQQRYRDILSASQDTEQSTRQLADACVARGDYANARSGYARYIEAGGPEEQVYAAMFRLAESMHQLGERWPVVQDAYLRAWAFRPSRAEPLHAVASAYRADQRYQLGYLFARRAAEIPFPDQDRLLVQADVYTWRAVDEQAVCADWTDRQPEAFRLFRGLLARADLPEGERRRIAGNRDASVEVMLAAASSYPQDVVDSLTTGTRDGEVTVTVAGGPDVEATLNSFLHCCTDIHRTGRFVVVGAGGDREALGERYPFLEFADTEPGIGDRFWLRIGAGWRFFAPEDYLTRLTAVLEAEPDVYQVGVNFADAAELTGACAAEHQVRRAPGTGRYVLTGKPATGPAMVDTTRGDHPGTATLDEVLCITAG